MKLFATDLLGQSTRSADIRSASVAGALAIALAASGCSGGSGVHQSSGLTVGSVAEQPDASYGSLHFVVESSHQGFSNSPRVLAVKWGRLANIYDSTGQLQQKDMVIGEDIPGSDPASFALTVNPVTDETAVTINFQYGSAEYANAFGKLELNLIPILDKSLSTSELPPYSLAPRNSALVVQFDDLLDHSTIKATTLKMFTGNPPILPYIEMRVIPDANHGDLGDFNGDGLGEFHTTRAIVDLTVSVLEAAASNPPVQPNALGLPASSTTNLPNVALRIPTQPDSASGQLALLKNASGHSISFTGSGSTDPSSVTKDVVRALRSGGPNDAHNGFLRDDILPRVVGTQPVTLGTVFQPTGGVNEFVTSLTFTYVPCASRMKVGDVIQQPGVFGEVTEISANPVGTLIAEVHFKIVFPAFDPNAPSNISLTAGQAEHSSVFDSVANLGQQACFVSFPSIAQPPSQKVATDSPVILRFSEPMDPVSVTPFDSFTVTRTTLTPTATDFIIGKIDRTADLREFTFTPKLDYKHTLNSAEHYFINVATGASGPRDLSGNALAVTLPQIDFQIDPAEATQNTGGFALRFSANQSNGLLDELGNDGKVEWRGQFLWNSVQGQIGPRPVNRFPAEATRDKAVPAIMPQFPQGVQTPLSSLGSRMQTLWRYCDVGFALGDESFYNVDVEGLDWAPVGGTVIADQFDKFEINVCHSRKLPDESINAALLPSFPQSGLVATFASNALDTIEDPLRTVHPRALGYNVNPADRFLSTTTPTVTMMPYPWNRGLPVAQHVFYTWRDTSKLSKGCPVEAGGGPGAELPIVVQVTGAGIAGTPYAPGNVPTVALPLLMEFKCFPDAGALGLNAFDINLADNSSAQPNFRAFSTGGTNASGTPIVRDPDLQVVAAGGFNPTSNPPGAATLPVDNTFYIGQMDLVTRISRVHSIWFNTNSSLPTFSTPVVNPADLDQPLGTSVRFDYRGATQATGNILTDATFLDAYGDILGGGGTVVFLNNDKTWKSSLTNLPGAKFFQVRLTFLSSAETLLTPTLTALGFAFRL